ncbi:hypothetical protein [Aureimonas pseudogalii]|uniref:Uncharacterized protein n=1 Tax=Aureimonas pseudogalii TaxID=1744844 RepID=A0A7W6H2Q4_9HYPH|nr:hypothetical protein [Aureimonas pseudogalii]MBB3996905.1 hypothetical protein [Aureimonas pseudogalii]
MSLAAEIVARAQARAESFKAEQAHLALRLRTNLAPTKPVTTPDAVARRLARDMVNLVALKESVDHDDLAALGWSAAAIREHGEAARAIAFAEREREV